MIYLYRLSPEKIDRQTDRQTGRKTDGQKRVGGRIGREDSEGDDIDTTMYLSVLLH